ncbi:predicted protein [Sclerotinia sclerotiorum 1980 UF-70]|uniref:Uncharacterized protein n=1 Tax=Sclerotinia sclerotiorum (strain ATCC 18683 / 1980 / Ss-1) TaxID=665079 RepID=A7F1L9_SCLS1|nr:predicted protein [Sclerotinia sclerotiorum 1980 UF-70]EDN95611.1 predicted protein [Sclerotinia sclerotiorum 1980 UF-70]
MSSVQAKNECAEYVLLNWTMNEWNEGDQANLGNINELAKREK